MRNSGSHRGRYRSADVGSEVVSTNGGAPSKTPITFDVIEIIPSLSDSRRERWTNPPGEIDFELGAQKWSRTRYIPSIPRRRLLGRRSTG